MTPTQVRASVVAERVAWVRQMVSRTRDLPLDSLETFLADSRNAGAAESYLRRGIEALLDIGRHSLTCSTRSFKSEFIGVIGGRKCFAITHP